MSVAVISLIATLAGGLITFLSWFNSKGQKRKRLLDQKEKLEKELKQLLTTFNTARIADISLELQRVRVALRDLDRK